MGSSSGLAGLKCLQWMFRGIQFVCSVVLLGIYSYYLATMASHKMTITTNTKAIEGISAIGTFYTALGLLFVCCCAGFPLSSFIAIVLDIGLIAAYIYVAVGNRDGASSCTGSNVNTVYGSGESNATPSSSGSGNSIANIPVSGLPTFQIACRLETVCLAAACIACIFFALSILLEISLNRNRHRASRPIRDADGEYISKSDYYGQGAPPQRQQGLRPLLGALPFRRREPVDPDVLPMHQQPGQMQTRQVETWGEVVSLHDSDRLYFNEGDDRDEHGPPVQFTSTTAPRPAADEYNEGEVAGEEYNLYQEDQKGNDHSETGQRTKQRESRAARAE
ncbi:hypothetical protein diail_8228, partial [Diaporthe ilicicola]